jgi:predicted lipoprotein with Yx(FWY)xxD motif
MNPSRTSHRRPWRTGSAAILAAAAVVAVMAGLAAARSATLTSARVHLTGPSGSRTEKIVVNGRGVTVYWLSGESTRHLLCTSAACLKFWPPVKATGRPTASGFSGRLGTLRRHGFTQVTLNGHPVYTFLQDSGKRGVATGDGVVAFGGTWHVFPTGSAGMTTSPAPGSSSTTSPAPGSSSTTSTNPYPGY